MVIDMTQVDSRQGLTFAQAEGAEEMPRQLQLREISPELRAMLWAYVHEHLTKATAYPGSYGGGPYWQDPWKTILKLWWIVRLHKNADEEPDVDRMKSVVKSHLTSDDYIKIFDFLQFVIQSDMCPRGFAETIDKFLSSRRAAYRVVERHIVPFSSDEQAEAVRSAMAVAREAGPKGPYSHLQAASAALSGGRWAEAVRDSIHAVEAAAKSIEPDASTLGPALDKLNKSIALNPALSKGYKALYGYTSDEAGIRHALIFEDEAKVSEHDAIFMFGACSAFVGYLIGVAREAGLAS